MNKRLKWLGAGVILIVIATIAACYHLEPGSGMIDSLYRQISLGMTRGDVSAILGTETEQTAHATFHLDNGLSRRCFVGTWKFTKWGRPYYIFVAFDEGNRVVWKRMRTGTLLKLGHWLFREEEDSLGGPKVTSIGDVLENKDEFIRNEKK